jgi:uncharacterized protein (TIGR02466 family)
MKLEVSTIFVEIIGQSHLPHHEDKNDYFYEKVKEIRDIYLHSPRDWRCDTFSTQSYYDLEKDSKFLEILADIKNLVSDFVKEYGSKKVNPVLTSAWINLAPPGEYQEYHFHSNNHISAVYYIKTPLDCGKMIFRSHGADKDILDMPHGRPPSVVTWEVDPLENKVVIFKSNLSHMVEKNKSGKDRVSIAMNFFLQNKYSRVR